MTCKKNTFLILALAVTSAFMTVAIVNAKPLYGEMALLFFAPGPVHPEFGPPVWSGTITGDINGYMYFYGTGAKDVGNTHQFWEVWLITDELGNILLTGTDKGVTNSNDKYRMNGVVAEAYCEYKNLVGHRVHMNGIITWDPVTGAPATAPGVFRVN